LKPYSVSFGGISERYSTHKDALFVVQPYSVDLTTTYVAGAKNGPRAILDASSHMELFDEETKLAPYKEGIFTAAGVEVESGPEDTLKEVEQRVASIVRSGKVPVLIGGEHTGTVGAVTALKKRHEDLTVIVFDAHADLRDSYMGSPWSHACVSRRILDTGAKLIQVGIRSMAEEEDRFLRKAENVKAFYASEVRENLEDVVKGIVGDLTEHVYVSVDLDVFDTGIMPAVGTPEPGGLSWSEVTDILREIFRRGSNVAGFDVMELSPIAHMVAPDYLAARLCYRMMAWTLANREDE
jgi:agmatinase